MRAGQPRRASGPNPIRTRDVPDFALAAELRTSHVRGATAPPLIAHSIGRHLEIVCRRWADRPALIACHQGIRKSYGELLDDVDRLAAGFLTSGLRPGERIGAWSRNRYEWVLVQLAAARAGLVLAALNPAYRARELEYALNKVGCAALFISDRSKTEDFLAIVAGLAPELGTAEPGVLRAARLPALRLVCVAGEPRIRGAVPLAALMAAPGARPGIATDAQAAAAIQFTSGTTAAPKAAVLSHANILNNGFFFGDALDLSQHDRLCVPVQLYHSYGMVAGVLSALTHGAAIVLPDERFAPLSTLRAIAEERCTALLGMPTMLASMLDHAELGRFDFSTLRTGSVSCSPCPSHVMQRAVERMHLPKLTVAYGMTETSPVSFQTATDDPPERRLTGVGRVHPHLEAKVIDAAGCTLACGEPGELLVRGYSVMLGYWDDAVATREAIDPDGWMHTGDIAVIDANGCCRLVGRAKEMVLRGGENVAPSEVEQLLYEHPSIAEAYAFGVPDARFGEEIAAWVRLRDGEATTAAAIRAFCRARGANFKVPRYVKFVDAFPVTASGKARRTAMREAMVAELAERTRTFTGQ